MMKKEENLIHIKLEYLEAVQSKRDILGTQRDLIEVLKMIKRYHIIRIQELKVKELLLKKIKELKLNLNKMNQAFPKIKIPNIIQQDSHSEQKEMTKKIKEISGKNVKGDNLEKELADIQKKLRELE